MLHENPQNQLLKNNDIPGWFHNFFTNPIYQVGLWVGNDLKNAVQPAERNCLSYVSCGISNNMYNRVYYLLHQNRDPDIS